MPPREPGLPLHPVLVALIAVALAGLIICRAKGLFFWEEPAADL